MAKCVAWHKYVFYNAEATGVISLCGVANVLQRPIKCVVAGATPCEFFANFNMPLFGMVSNLPRWGGSLTEKHMLCKHVNAGSNPAHSIGGVA